MKEKDFVCAKVVYDALCIKSDCLDMNGVIRPFEYVVAIDDDVTSAIWAVKKAREIHKIYGYYPPILCVGGVGILSRHLYDKPEAQVLADACRALGYSDNLLWVQGLDTGKNAVENINNVAMITDVNSLNRPRVLFCVTKRQSLVYALTQRKHQPYLEAGWYVIDESFEEAFKLMNAKSLCGGELMFQELAGILRDAMVNQLSLPFSVSPEVRNAAYYLKERYGLLAQPQWNLRAYAQYVKYYVSVMWNKGRVREAIAEALEHNL